MKKDFTDLFGYVAGVAIFFSAGWAVFGQETKPNQLEPGAFELRFKNGAGARGEVLKVEQSKFQFKPFDAPAFTMPIGRVETMRPLSPDEVEIGRAIAESQTMEHAAAMDRLLPLLEKVGDAGLLGPVREEIARRETEHNRATSAVRDKRREAWRAKYDKLVETRSWQDALDLTETELADYKTDTELLANAVMMQYRIHRGAAKSPLEFRSANLDQLRKLNPKSTVLHGIDIERETAARGQINFAKEREQYIADALGIAQRHYEHFQLEEARDVLERALGYQPPAETAVPLRRLLEKVNAEMSSDRADAKAREIVRQKDMKESLKDATTRSQVITEQQSRNFDNRVQKKAGYAPRMRR